MLSGILNFLSSANNKMSDQERLQKIRTQLFSTTYHNNIKFIIEKICLEMMKSHPQFSTQVLAFIQNNQPRRFLEIGGVMNYTYNGKKRDFKVFMMFNQFFPNKAPYVRVVNSENQPVNYHYDLCQSPNDEASYVLNSKLNNLTSWIPGKSLLPVFSQIQCLFEMHPFYQADLGVSQKKQKKNGIFSKKQQKKVELQKPAEQFIANRGSSYQTNQKQKIPSKQTIEQDYNMKQCKLCFDNSSEMINTSCGHIMMCQECYRAYRKKFGSDTCQCPICKTKGQYIKFIQPKFA